MKTLIKLASFFVIFQSCYASDLKNNEESTLKNETLITTKSEFSDRLMFTCKIAGIDLDPFIFNSNTKKLIHPVIFLDEKKNSINTKFTLENITDEYILLTRAYNGEKHRISGKVKEQIFILRYASKIGNDYAVKAKSKVFVNNEELSGNDGRCDFVNRLF